MASTINADNGVVSGSSGLKSTADTSGVLALQSNGSTGITLGTDLVTTLANPLPVGSGGTGATSLSGITAGTATNLAGGSNGTIPYQSASGTTQMLAAGTSGQVLTSNGAAAPAWTDPSAVGTADFVAYGSITAGQAVALRSDGKVERVFGVTQSASNGSETAAATSNNSELLTSTYDPVNQKVICVYKNGASNRVDAVVGTVSGTTITFGTAQIIASASNPGWCAATYDTVNQKLVVAYSLGTSTDDGYAVVGSVSGTTITVGTPVLFTSGQAQYTSICFDSVNAKVVIAYRDGGDSDRGKAIVGTVSGTSISFGSIATFDANIGVTWVTCVYEPLSAKVVICYDRSSGFAIAGTVSGTSISFGTAYEFDTATMAYISADSLGGTGKVIVAMRDTSNTFGRAVVLSVSGSTITGGSLTTFNSGATGATAVCYDPLAGVANIYFQDSAASSQGTWVIATISGTSLSFNAESIFNAAITSYITAVYDPSTYKQVTFWADGGLSSQLRAMVFANTVNFTNATSFIGLSTETVADGATATITINGGINENQSGLTAGSKYWLNSNGTLTTSNTGYPVAGIATSATNLLVGTNFQYAGALVYISTTTVSSPVASVDITSGFSSTYDDYVILFENVVFSGSSVNIYLRMYKNSTLITSSTYLTQRLLSSSATTNSSTNSAVTASQFGVGRSDAQTFGEIRVFNANSANVSLLTRVSCLGGGESSIYQMSIRNTASNSLTGISLYDTSGTYNFTSGTFRLYGVAKS